MMEIDDLDVWQDKNLDEKENKRKNQKVGPTKIYLGKCGRILQNERDSLAYYLF